MYITHKETYITLHMKQFMYKHMYNHNNWPFQIKNVNKGKTYSGLGT